MAFCAGLCWEMLNNPFLVWGELWFVAFANFSGINTPLVTDSNLPMMWLPTELGEGAGGLPPRSWANAATAPHPPQVCVKDIRGCEGQGQQQEGQLWLPGVLFSASPWMLAISPPLDSFVPFGVTSLTLFPTVPSPIPFFSPVHWCSLQVVFQKESQTLLLRRQSWGPRWDAWRGWRTFSGRGQGYLCRTHGLCWN